MSWRRVRQRSKVSPNEERRDEAVAVNLVDETNVEQGNELQSSEEQSNEAQQQISSFRSSLLNKIQQKINSSIFFRTGCLSCDEGTFSNPGSSVCMDCDHTAGFVSKQIEGDETRNRCEYCGPTLFANHTHHICSDCPLGTFSVGGTDECTTCNATNGYIDYTNSGERNACRYCGVGTKAVAGDTNDCVKCGR